MVCYSTCPVLTGTDLVNNLCLTCNYTCATCNGLNITDCDSCDSAVTHRALTGDDCFCVQPFFDNGKHICELCVNHLYKCNKCKNITYC